MVLSVRVTVNSPSSLTYILEPSVYVRVPSEILLVVEDDEVLSAVELELDVLLVFIVELLEELDSVVCVLLLQPTSKTETVRIRVKVINFFIHKKSPKIYF